MKVNRIWPAEAGRQGRVQVAGQIPVHAMVGRQVQVPVTVQIAPVVGPDGCVPVLGQGIEVDTQRRGLE